MRDELFLPFSWRRLVQKCFLQERFVEKIVSISAVSSELLNPGSEAMAIATALRRSDDEVTALTST